MLYVSLHRAEYVVVAMSCHMFHGVWLRDGGISSRYYTLLLVSPTVTSAPARSDFDRTVGVSQCSRILPPDSSQALQQPTGNAAVSFSDTAITYREIMWGNTRAGTVKYWCRKGLDIFPATVPK